MKQPLLISLLVFISLNCFSQFPIGQPALTAEKQIKQYLKSKGFTFYKKSKEENNIELAYSEEFVVILSINGFGNAWAINYSPSKKILNRLLTALDFGNWTLVESKPVKWSPSDTEFTYHYNNYKIRYVDLGAVNITISEIP